MLNLRTGYLCVNAVIFLLMAAFAFTGKQYSLTAIFGGAGVLMALMCLYFRHRSKH